MEVFIALCFDRFINSCDKHRESTPESISAGVPTTALRMEASGILHDGICSFPFFLCFLAALPVSEMIHKGPKIRLFVCLSTCNGGSDICGRLLPDNRTAPEESFSNGNR